MEFLISGFTDGQFEQSVLFHSKLTITVRIDFLAVGALIQLKVCEMGILIHFNLFFELGWCRDLINTWTFHRGRKVIIV